MKQQISPKAAAIIIGVVAVVILGIGYKIFFSRSASAGVKIKPGNERFLHPIGPDNPLPGVMMGGPGNGRPSMAHPMH